MVGEKKNLAISIGPGVRALPIVHGSVEFTRIVREHFLLTPPRALVVELPEELAEVVVRVMNHADEIPVISVRSRFIETELHFVVEPLEPIVEAVRSAVEAGIPIYFADTFSHEPFFLESESLPDTFSLQVMTPFEYYRAYVSLDQQRKKDFLIEISDKKRELKMAQTLRNVSLLMGEVRDILFVCGMRHLNGVWEYLKLPVDSFETEYNSLHRVKISDEEPLESYFDGGGRDQTTPPEISISFLSRESTEVLAQPAFYNMAWLFTRRSIQSVRFFNRIALQRTAYRESVNRYERESGELIPPSREKLYFRFARNWSVIENMLVPDLYRLVLSARAFGGDNFARITYDVLSFLQPIKSSAFPVRKITLDDLYRDSRLIRFRIRMKKKRKVPPPKIRQKLKREKYPGEWIDSIKAGGICSYPPEDIIIENFGKLLQKRAAAIIRGSEERSLPFVSSLMDGIDYRETIRNFHDEKIIVRERFSGNAEAGSVVIIFDEDDEVHNWKVVWWGEHNQESDMAFYATPPGERITGPGIFRCTYGGLMMTHPPGRLYDIWSDEAYAEFEKPSEHLLAAALEYNDRRTVVYLASRPPSAKMQYLAGKMGQKIVHIPITTINPVTLGRVRRFHVLDSHERRGEAGDHIW